jgi:hypothetical protein
MSSRLASLLVTGLIACAAPAPEAAAPATDGGNEADASATSPDAGPPACADAAAWGRALAPYVDGLLYMSESDRPLEPAWWASQATGAIDAEAVRALAGLDASAVLEVRDYDAWFDKVAVAQDWMDDGQKAAAARYAQLRAFLDARLTQRTVVRAGTVEVRVFVVGRDACGHVAGFSTVAIET